MSRRVEHTFENPTLEVATIGFEGRPTVRFGVLAELGNTNVVAKLCFCSYMVGPGQKIILGRGDIPYRPD
jgi:hypothetical protein